MAACRSSLVAASTQTSTGSLRVPPRRLTARSSSAFRSFDLQRVGHQADLVEKNRPAMCHLQEAGLGLPRVGERAALESEKLRFEQCVGNGCAVDVHERRSCPRPGLVDDLRDQPLARAGLTLNQDRRQAALRAA